MKLLSTLQIAQEELNNIRFDLFICASGFEKRATNSLQYLNLDKIKVKIAFGFEDRHNQQRLDNDLQFERNKIELRNFSGNAVEEIEACVLSEIDAIQSKQVRIFVDYSSMTRSWYAAVITAIRSVSAKVRVECYFSYSPASFEEPPSETAPNEVVSPISGFGGLEPIDGPTALIIGLGYEKDRAIGLFEYVDPGACFAFFTDPPLDVRYSDVLKSNNASFLSLIGEDNHYKHPLMDIQRTGNLLMSLVWGLTDNYRVILAPLGVKPFCLLCLLLAVRYPDLDVWRVTSGTKSGAPVREAVGPVLVICSVFEG